MSIYSPANTATTPPNMATDAKGKPKKEKQGFNLSLLRRVWSLALPYSGIVALAFPLMLLNTAMGVVRPYLVQETVNNTIVHHDAQGLLRNVLLIIALIVAEFIGMYSFIMLTNRLGQSVIRDLRTRVFGFVMRLRLGYFDTTPIGQSVTRTINDIETINTFFSEDGITALADIISLFAVLGMMLFTNWKLTVICLIPLPFLLAATYWFKEGVKTAYATVRTQVSNMNSFLQERLSGMRIVQLFAAETKEQEGFRTINAALRKANIDAVFHYALFFPIVEIISAASIGLMVWWGAGAVVQKEVTLGALIAFPLYLGLLYRPVRMLADKFNTLQMGLIAAERVFKLLDDATQIEPTGGKLAPKQLAGDIVFDNVTFAYTEERDVLHGISLNINAGETLAIVGSTGSGKTTMISILTRFYELKAGRILIDGHDLHDYALPALRARIGVVLQDVFLFAGSVMENITLRDPRITPEQVHEAARMIGAEEFIERLPDGYNYQVRERGAMLSAGQRQLISFVRALVFNPDILILDEATSSIDPETESVIQYAIEQLVSKRTSIIIAHRLSTIRHADRILVLDGGHIAELGTHEELLANPDGHYSALYYAQLQQGVEA